MICVSAIADLTMIPGSRLGGVDELQEKVKGLVGRLLKTTPLSGAFGIPGMWIWMCYRMVGLFILLIIHAHMHALSTGPSRRECPHPR
jgi:hypothetical protein